MKEFFAHIIEARQFVAALKNSGKLQENFELAQGHFARGIERRLGEIPKAAGLSSSERALRGVAHAGALLSLLTWWIDRGMKETPEEMDNLFHRMVWGEPR